MGLNYAGSAHSKMANSKHHSRGKNLAINQWLPYSIRLDDGSNTRALKTAAKSRARHLPDPLRHLRSKEDTDTETAQMCTNTQTLEGYNVALQIS